MKQGLITFVSIVGALFLVGGIGAMLEDEGPTVKLPVLPAEPPRPASKHEQEINVRVRCDDAIRAYLPDASISRVNVYTAGRRHRWTGMVDSTRVECIVAGNGAADSWSELHDAYQVESLSVLEIVQ